MELRAMFSAISIGILRSPGAFILYGWLDFFAQCLGGAQRPVWIAQQLTRQKHDVRLIGLKDRLRLCRLRDHSDGACCNPCLLSTLLCKWNLIARPNGNLHPRHESAAGNVDQIHLHGLQDSAELDRLRQVPTPFFPIRRRDSKKQRQACGPDFPHPSHDVNRKTNSIFEAASIFILTTIAQRRKKLVDQVTMRSVNLERFKTRIQRPCRRLAKRLDHFADFVWCERTRHRIVVRKGGGARRDGFPSARFQWHFLASQPRRTGAPLAACMCQLHPGDGALAADKLRNGPPRRNMRIEINSSVHWRNPATRLD